MCFKSSNKKSSKGPVSLVDDSKPENKEYDEVLKFLLIGESGVGKTAVTIRYADEMFADMHISTIGVDFKRKDVTHNGKTYRMQIWDTAGQERYRTIVSSYYRSVKGIAVVYDVTSKESFEKVSTWVEEIHQNVNYPIGIVLIGNKIDLQREVKKTEAEAIAKKYEMGYFETSAKSGEGVSEAFELLLERAVSP
mmetsp:Transcript_7161/g.10549  ORF Transcript_7161/g.10549 Transcript_7161/m.10549 type:complete len:194 (+) Transcript_7161:32-613(+)